LQKQAGMNKKTLIVSALVWCSLMFPALLLASGCIELGCTLADCSDQASIVLHRLEADQSYEVEIEADDGTIVTCTIDDSGETGIDCSNTLSYYRQLDRAHIALLGAPERVAVTVRQGETVLHQEEVTPSYDEFAPNGETCGPVCRQAEAHVVLL
jgi:hypothetical protein